MTGSLKEQIVVVEFTNSAVKDLKRLPEHIVTKLRDWANAVQSVGIEAVRRSPGYHDEPLRGSRDGQRSIRLSKAYRAFYVEDQRGNVRIITVIEVNRHEY